jgi:hypothetical protein
MRNTSVAEARIQEGWETGKLCDAPCGCASIHFPGEYGCIFSDVVVYVPHDCEFAVARWTAERLGLSLSACP